MPLLSPFQLREAKDPSDEKLLGDIASHGWHIVQVMEEPSSPAFAFTVGLYYQFLQPEMLIMGLDLNYSAHILNAIGEAMRAGQQINWPGRYEGFVEGFDLELTPIDLSHYEEYLGYANWFYRSLPDPFPAMQCIWPDKNGVFPGETGYDSRFFQLQRLLTTSNKTVLGGSP